jgi:2-amino-4-hydroxy-6-hydroxymethyldihydropteridine diphosphokinase
VIPHPRLHERRFVLEPLFEIAPALAHPVLGLTVAELRRRCPDRSAVERWSPSEGARA